MSETKSETKKTAVTGEVLLGLIPLHEGEPLDNLKSHMLYYSFFVYKKPVDEEIYFVNPQHKDFLEKIPKLGSRIRSLARKASCSALFINNGIMYNGDKKGEPLRKNSLEINSETLAHFLAVHLPDYTRDHVVIHLNKS